MNMRICTEHLNFKAFQFNRDASTLKNFILFFNASDFFGKFKKITKQYHIREKKSADALGSIVVKISSAW